MDALPLDVPSARGDVTRHRDSQTTSIAQVGEGLNQSLAECVLSKQKRPTVILECASQDFASACGPTVDQGHHWPAVQLPRTSLNGVGDSVAIACFHDRLLIQEHISHCQSGAHQPTRVVPEIQHEPLNVLVGQLFKSFSHLGRNAFTELRDAQVAEGVSITAQAACSHRPEVDGAPFKTDLFGFS